MHGSYKITPGGPEESVARIEALAKLMDGAFVLPGTNIRLGLDAIIGLVPVAGDLIAGLISSYLIWEARRLGAPKWLIARMMANTLLDTTIGAIPVLGDAFDVMFRANMKNMGLLRRHMDKAWARCPGGADHRGRSRARAVARDARLTLLPRSIRGDARVPPCGMRFPRGAREIFSVVVVGDVGHFSGDGKHGELQ